MPIFSFLQIFVDVGVYEIKDCAVEVIEEENAYVV